MIFGIACIINAIAIYFINKNITFVNKTKMEIPFDIIDRLKAYKSIFTLSFIKNFNYTIPYYNVIIVALTTIIAIINRVEKNKYLNIYYL